MSLQHFFGNTKKWGKQFEDCIPSGKIKSVQITNGFTAINPSLSKDRTIAIVASNVHCHFFPWVGVQAKISYYYKMKLAMNGKTWGSAKPNEDTSHLQVDGINQHFILHSYCFYFCFTEGNVSFPKSVKT